MESSTENAQATWGVPQCPFTVEYTPRVLDDIRLAVVDAFFSLPRGGAEIGGILLGHYGKGRVKIQDYVPLPCEHASGPSFLLSPKDHEKLAELLATARGNPRGGQPVGWYHSHTRSEILLSEADLDIHKRYFPEPWHVALVLKPHTFQPTRAGFFFRESDGSLRDSSCYLEIVMEPLAVRPLPELADSLVEPAVADPPSEAAVLPEAPPPPPIQPAPPPALVQAVPKRSYKGWGIAAAVLLVLALGAWAYQTRELWQVPPTTEVLYLGLNTQDLDGQLQIRWDRNSPSVRNARDGILIIEDGPKPEAVELDATHLKAGVFTYARKGARVDVSMTLNLADGQKAREATSFLGEPPRHHPTDEEIALRKERDDLAERNRKLEKSLQDARSQLKKAPRKTKAR